jgi:autotransporter-associated beta strand protein
MKRLLAGGLALVARAIRFATGADQARHGMAAGQGLRRAPCRALRFSAASDKRVSRSVASLATVAAVVVGWTAILPLSPAEAQCATTGTSPGTVTFTCAQNTTTTSNVNSTSPNPSTSEGTQHFGSAPLVGQVNSGVTISGEGLTLQGGGTVSMTNNGTITTSVFQGKAVDLETAGGTGSAIFNNTGSVSSTGSGGASGVISSSNLIVTNSGTISGAEDGVAGNANLTVTNSGTISGAFGIGGGTGFLTVTNSSSGIISGGASIQTFSPLNLTNFGTLSGNIDALGTASSAIVNSGTILGVIRFTGGSSGNSMTLAPGSVITGQVLGSGTDTLQLGGSGAATFNVSNIGAGQQYQGFSTFNKVGLSTWTLTGSGAQNWTISQGALVGDTNSVQGSQITNNATLAFIQGATGTYAGSISGSGSLDKEGLGEVIMTGANTYTGPTVINGGALVVDGSIVSPTTVNAGGTLAGIGAVGATSVASGGTLSPGHNGIGTLTVNGNLAFATDATYVFGVSGVSSGFTNVTGTATLTGAIASAQFQGTTFANKYTILSAAGGLGLTEFSKFQTNSSAITAKLSYTATDVILNLISGFTSIGGLSGTNGLTRNQTAVAAALDNAFNNGGKSLTGLLGLSAGQLPAAFDALSGEGISAAQQTAFGAGNVFTTMMMDQGAFWRGGAAEKPAPGPFAAMPAKAPLARLGGGF